jgi:hypothetical protein
MLRGGTLDQSALLDLVRGLIRAGQLPREGPTQVIAGYGDGDPCAVCGKAMQSSAVVYDARFGRRTVQPLSMHFECFVGWDHARHAIKSPPRASANP